MNAVESLDCEFLILSTVFLAEAININQLLRCTLVKRYYTCLLCKINDVMVPDLIN